MKNPYRIPQRFRARMEVNNTTQGEPIHKAIDRMLNNGEDPSELKEKELIFKRPEDQLGEHDIRHDWRDEMIENSTAQAQKHKDLDAGILKARKDIVKKNEEVAAAKKAEKKDNGDQAKTTD